MRRHLKIVVAVPVVTALGFFSADAQQNGARGQAPGVNSLTQNFLAQHEIGRRFHIDPADLPPPKTGAIVTDRALIVPYSGQVPQVPPGFMATPFATGLVNPRRLLVLPNGDVLVAEQSAGYLTLLRDDGSGYATWIDRHVEDLNKPYGWLGGTTYRYHHHHYGYYHHRHYYAYHPYYHHRHYRYHWYQRAVVKGTKAGNSCF